MPGPIQKCYPAQTIKPLCFAGYAMIVLGIILLFCCAPCWIWLAVLGVSLMVAGVLLLRISKAWR